MVLKLPALSECPRLVGTLRPMVRLDSVSALELGLYQPHDIGFLAPLSSVCAAIFRHGKAGHGKDGERSEKGFLLGPYDDQLKDRDQ